MPTKYYFLLLIAICILQQVSAQIIGFEKGIPSNFQHSQKSTLNTSRLYYKEGKQSLEWKYQPNSNLYFQLNKPLILSEEVKENAGISLWIYNETPQQDSITFEFLAPNGTIPYHFSFQLTGSGWRACWIGFQHMQREKNESEITGYRLVSPNIKGRIFIDRLTFPVKNVNQRTTPDMQMPTNNFLSYRDLRHWCCVWKWEQFKHDLPLPQKLTNQETTELKLVENNLTTLLTAENASPKKIEEAYNVFQKANIQPSGKGFIGSPLVTPDELNRNNGEISWNDLETMLSGFAYDAYYNQSPKALENYFLVWNYAMDQGFSYGSGMGTNHHYGYRVRKIYTTAWLMRDAIWQHELAQKIISTLVFWSALQETRKPFLQERDGLLDTWNTLLMAKTVSALMFNNPCERIRSLKALSRWISSSLKYTPGTMGGIKIDGTTFHHGGFYPAYTTGVLAMIGQFCFITKDTQYQLTLEGRKSLKTAFLAMRNYCNKYEWGIGLSGRHPFGGSMKEDDVTAFAYLALSGDLSGRGDEFDHSLAADYLRLCTKETPETRYFRKHGIQPSAAPQGFFVYNYGSAGIFRGKEWMVTLKGYNTDVWGSEIYAKDNRYGRYQSYGSIQIMGQPSRLSSGYDMNGWDWNRLPGTTSIHLPYELLDSPLPKTTMVRSKENFAGSSTLDGKDGMFAMKLMEQNLKNFTPDFVACKSVFCFDNRMICLGTGISNSNNKYSTETTLFQSIFDKTHPIVVENNIVKETGFQSILKATNNQPVYLKDGYQNHYFIKSGEVQIQAAQQQSLHEKTRKPTHGTFASAWINHGKAPQNENYEYMIWIQPTEKELKEHTAFNTYQVLQCDQKAHIVTDLLNGTTAYAIFEEISKCNSELFISLPAETMIMHKIKNKKLHMSVCDPNLNLKEKTYSTKEQSRIITKNIVLKGRWDVINGDQRVSATEKEGKTTLTVLCQHGQPVTFSLNKLF